MAGTRAEAELLAGKFFDHVGRQGFELLDQAFAELGQLDLFADPVFHERLSERSLVGDAAAVDVAVPCAEDVVGDFLALGVLPTA